MLFMDKLLIRNMRTHHSLSEYKAHHTRWVAVIPAFIVCVTTANLLNLALPKPANPAGQPVDGGWGIWHLTPCAKLCGEEAKRLNIRTCNNPEPQNGGQECVREDGSQTTPTNRIEVAETIQCGNTITPCPQPLDTTPPSIPTNVRATVLSDTKIHLTWDPSTDNKGVLLYRIYNEQDIEIGVSQKTYYTPANFKLNEYTVALLNPSTTYTFKVTAVDETGNESSPSLSVQATTLAFQAGTSVINPFTDIEYKGAFRLPGGSGGSRWGYGGVGLAYYPGGNPNGPNDGYPGSLFGFGHVYDMYVSEISIPKPIISPTKNINDLNVAQTLQPFAKVIQDPPSSIPVGGIVYLPKQGNQTSDKLYYINGSDYQWSKVVSHYASDLTLATPNTQGGWYVGSKNGDPPYYSTVFYLFDIPKAWADTYADGRLLATGGTRSGAYNGFGNALYALAPWKDGTPFPPRDGELSYLTLLEYGQVEGVNTQDGRVINDHWDGGAWLTSGDKSAVVFVGSKMYGEVSYKSGYYSTFSKPSFMFYDPKDLEAVVKGLKQPYEPQPYAVIDVGKYLFNDEPIVKSCAYDRQNGLLYVFEYNQEQPIIHVWKVGVPGTATLTAPSGTSCDPTPTYIWNAVSNATWYYLWVNGPSGNVLKQWYTAAQAHCASGTGTCAIAPATTLASGNHIWWIQTWNSVGYGPWSAGQSFTVSSGSKPGAVTLIAPSGSSANPPPWYWWYEDSCATWYYLWVNGPSGNVIKQWYTSAQANCNGTWCWVTNATTLPAGTNTWWVQTWNSTGYGPWSAGMGFIVSASANLGAIAPISIHKRGSGKGTILGAGQTCGPDCPALSIPYIEHAATTLQVIPEADSYFVRWETADGVPLEQMYYAQPGDMVIAVFEKK
jgi:hypothetical protein